MALRRGHAVRGRDGREGRFAFPGVPPGTYRLKAWHELFGEKSQPVTVPATGAAKADVTLSLLDSAN